jgi:hypothetical protein
MSPRVVEDMVPNKRGRKTAPPKASAKGPSPFLQSLQKDLQKESRARAGDVDSETSYTREEPSMYPPYVEAPRRKDSFSKKWYALIALIVFLGGSFIFLSSRPNVIVSVTPRNEIKPISLSATAQSVGASTTLAYTLLEEVEETSFTIPAAGSKDIDRRAQGQIVIFNSFSTSPQTLAARTRFEGTGGKIFRITSSVRVPGYTTKAGTITPGSIEVTVYADETGDDYNIGLSDFTLPGLKSNATQYAKIIARSKTEMSGGFSGKIKLYDEAALQTEKVAAEKKLSESLSTKIQAKVPADSTLFTKALAYTYAYDVNDRVDVNKADEPVTVKLTATARGMLLKTADVYTLLARDSYPEVAEPIEVANLSEVIFTPSSPDALTQKTPEDITFTLTGDAHFVWAVATEAVQKALAGSPKDTASYQAIFKENFPTVISANVESFSPFWMRHFPNDPSTITIKRVIPVNN